MTNLRQAIEAFPENVDEIFEGTPYEGAFGGAPVRQIIRAEEELDRTKRINAALVQLQAQVIEELVKALKWCVAESYTEGKDKDEALELADMVKQKQKA